MVNNHTFRRVLINDVILVHRPVVFNLFAGAEPQENIPVARGTPVQ